MIKSLCEVESEETVQKGYRTKAKDEIMSYILSNKHRRVSASEIYEHIKNSGKHTNLTTVYRNLDKLTEAGVILKIKNSSDDYSVYQLLDPDGGCDEHLHIQCRGCGHVYHLEGEAMDKINACLLEECGYSIICSDSFLLGYCSSCRKDKDLPEKH